MTRPIPNEVIDWTILNEIIQMDEDDSEFSRNLILQYIDQANTTFAEIEEELNHGQDLKKLNELGHFLKGSSASLGLQRIAWVCERIQDISQKSEDSFPDENVLLGKLPKGVNKKDIVFQPAKMKLDHSNVYLEADLRALNHARVEFQLAKMELSKYYKTQL